MSDEQGIRLQKVLAQAGLASRRAADESRSMVNSSLSRDGVLIRSATRSASTGPVYLLPDVTSTMCSTSRRASCPRWTIQKGAPVCQTSRECHTAFVCSTSVV